jgi:hypothetical protein
MLVAIYNAKGEVLMCLDGTEDTIKLNVPKNGRFKRLGGLAEISKVLPPTPPGFASAKEAKP